MVYTLSRHFLNDRFPVRTYITDDRIEYVLLSPESQVQDGNRTIYWRYISGIPCEAGRSGCQLKVVVAPGWAGTPGILTAYPDHSKHTYLEI